MIQNSFIKKYPVFFIKSLFRWRPISLKVLKFYFKQLDDELLECLVENPYVKKDKELIDSLNELSKNHHREISFYLESSVPENSFDGLYDTEWENLCYNVNLKKSKPHLVRILDDFYKENTNNDEPEYYNDDDYQVYTDSYRLSENFPWTEDLIFRYRDKLNWKALSTNKKINWDENLINKFSDYINWTSAAKNKSFPWTFDIIEKYCQREISDIDIEYREFWLAICKNPSLVWTEAKIEEYFQKIDYLVDLFDHRINDDYFDSDGNKLDIDDRHPLLWWLSYNESINWNLELIDKYFKHWNWTAFLSNKSLPWNKDLLELVVIKSNHLEWKKLSSNRSIKFDFETLIKYEFLWDFERLLPNNGFGRFIKDLEISEKEIENHLSNVKALYDNNENIFYTGINQTVYQIDDQMNFGKFKGQKIGDIYLNNPSYILFCIEKVNFFIITPSEFKRLIDLNSKQSIPEFINHLVFKKWGYWCIGDAKEDELRRFRNFDSPNYDEQNWDDGRCPACLGDIPCGCNWANEQGW